jgi:hypothetical protein
MKERPVIFNDLEVRAAIAGTKTQFRRVLTVPWKGSHRAFPYEPYWIDDSGVLVFCDEYGDYHRAIDSMRCPFGSKGDVLWVKEAHQLLTGNGHRWVYRADGEPKTGPSGSQSVVGMHWRSSVCMPRNAGRLFLKITDISIQRLQVITEDDAKAEGFEPQHRPADLESGQNGLHTTARNELQRAWDRLDATKNPPWAHNPWVWVITFKSVTKYSEDRLENDHI